jgi:hypothetical protein
VAWVAVDTLQWSRPCGQGLLRVDYLQVIDGCAIEPLYRESRELWSRLFSHGSFPNMLTKRSMKCLRGDKLFQSCVFVTVPSPVP